MQLIRGLGSKAAQVSCAERAPRPPVFSALVLCLSAGLVARGRCAYELEISRIDRA